MLRFVQKFPGGFMRVLLDTNIVIHRENIKPTNNDIGLLFYWLDRLHYEKCIHPLTIAELRKLQDKNIQGLYNVKLPAYTELKTTSHPTQNFIEQLPVARTENDKIDNRLLYEVYNNRVDLLITEDKGLLNKAKLLNLENRVLSINEFISRATEENPALISYKMLSVKKEYFGNINLRDSFFDTFRSAYVGFDDWFNRKSDEEAYVCKTDDDKIMGFLYLKTENESEIYSDIEPVFPPKRRLKVGTFKVETSGFRLGERFIKIIFDNALDRKVDEIYITLFEDRPELKALEDLITAWGFLKYGVKRTNGKEEVVFCKKLNLYDNNLSVKGNFPNILFRNKQKFILPIYPVYHTTLLPDSKLNTENEVDFLGKEPHRYALQKVYISFSWERNINPGDILLFYRNGEEGSSKKYTSVLTTIGIVDSIKYGFQCKEDFFESCQNRSVFPKKDLESFWKNNKDTLLVVKFIFVKSLTKRLTLEYLWNQAIVELYKGPRPFTRISDKQFNQILCDSQTKISFVGEQ